METLLQIENPSAEQAFNSIKIVTHMYGGACNLIHNHSITLSILCFIASTDGICIFSAKQCMAEQIQAISKQ